MYRNCMSKKQFYIINMFKSYRNLLFKIVLKANKLSDILVATGNVGLGTNSMVEFDSPKGTLASSVS